MASFTLEFSYIRLCNVDKFQTDFCVPGYSNTVFTHVRTRAYTKCSQLKNSQVFKLSPPVKIQQFMVYSTCMQSAFTISTHLVLCILSIILNAYKYIFYVLHTYTYKLYFYYTYMCTHTYYMYYMYTHNLENAQVRKYSFVKLSCKKFLALNDNSTHIQSHVCTPLPENISSMSKLRNFKHISWRHKKSISPYFPLQV